MFHCRLRALTLDKKPFYFTARDVPVKVYSDVFTLANRPGTPLLEISSLCRAMDHLPLAEGDKVLIGGTEYQVSYYRGFDFRSDNKVVIPSNLVDTYSLVSMGDGSSSKIQFKYHDCVFQLPSFFGCLDGRAVISASTELADVDELQISAGFSHKKRKIFFGDMVDGKEVLMWRGRPCVLQEGKYVEMPTGNLLGGVEE